MVLRKSPIKLHFVGLLGGCVRSVEAILDAHKAQANTGLTHPDLPL